MNCHAQALLRHFIARLGTLEGVDYSDTPWHSATFDGARHCFTFTVNPAVDVAAFAQALPETDIVLPSGFVADALVTNISGTRVTVEALTIDAA